MTQNTLAAAAAVRRGRRRRWLLAGLCGAGLMAGQLVGERAAMAGDFDALGGYLPAPDAVVTQGFAAGFDIEKERYLPSDVKVQCVANTMALKPADDALMAGQLLLLTPSVADRCSERVLVTLPKTQGSYRASVWMRHGSVDAQVLVKYPAESGLRTSAATLAPTGRVTSDGWVELASNVFPVDGAVAAAVYLRVSVFDSQGSEIDALELTPVKAPYWQQRACTGLADPVCGEGALCIHNYCRLGRLSLPPLPHALIRDTMVDVMQSQLRVFFGGQKTRTENLPHALAMLDTIRSAKNAWQFWNGWGYAIRLLHDWHTRADSSVVRVSRRARLNVCFFEGDGDSSVAAWPKHPKYRDILVSHTGNAGTHGIRQGDRLVAVDGQHPVAWALSLKDVDWGWWQADDNDVYSEMAERMRGLILAYATSFSVLHCDSVTQTCADVPQTYLTAELPDEGGSQVRCDNRPFYHLAAGNNPNANHSVGFGFFRGPVADAPPEDMVYSLVWDTLYGGGDPNGYVNTHIKDAITDFKANARGVILDHRAGNGGTLDAAELVTTLVRPPDTALIFYSPMQRAGFAGPTTAADGIALFEQFKSVSGMTVGAPDYDADMPVALVLHRDGSASDYMPFGMQGAAKVKLFAPAATAGAFSTFFEFSYWGGVSLRLASGDAIAADGSALLGHGVQPDFLVLPKQSDLLAGKDTLYEAALAWVQTELKP